MTRQEFREKIKRKLGYPTVKVELTSAALNDCVDDALNIARKYGCGHSLNQRYYVLQLSAGVSAYDLPQDVASIESYVYCSTSVEGFGSMVSHIYSWQTTSFPFYGTWSLSDVGDLLTYHNYLAYIETWKKYTIERFIFQIDQPQKRIIVQPTPTSADFQSGYSDLVLLSLWVEFDENIVFDNIEVQKLATALAKKVLGHIRGKYTGYNLPGAQGASLNADVLLQEAQQEEQEAIQALKEQEEGLGFILA